MKRTNALMFSCSSLIFLFFCNFFTLVGFVCAQGETFQDDSIEVIETEMNEDDFLPKEKGLLRAPIEAISANPRDMNIETAEILKLNQTLKNIITENQKLSEEKKVIDDRLRLLRGQREVEVNQMNSVIIERDSYRQQNETVVDLNLRLKQELDSLKSELVQKEKDYEEKLAVFKQQAGETSMMPTEAGTMAVPSFQNQTDLLTMIDLYNFENRKLKTDAAKIHYNMGNMYFKKGEYEKSAEEFQKSVDLLPQDANAHFNLAFVCGEYLNQHERALKHYQEYLYLKPDAQDYKLVHEKILQSEVFIKGAIDSIIQKEAIGHSKGNFKF